MSATSATNPAGGHICGALGRWLFSSLGKKSVVAATGIVLVLFVIGHLLGNLTIFFGPEAMNSYAQHLRDLGPLLWAVRALLLAAVALHIYFTMLVWRENAAAHPQKYAVSARMKTTVFARTMRLSGLIVLAFIAFHLAHFTLLLVNPVYATYHTMVNGREAHDVYRMAVSGFRNPWVSGFYVLALGLVAFHLSHGLSSLFQTLGFSTQTVRPVYERWGRIVAWLLFLGYASIPLSVLFLGLGGKVAP